MGFETKQPNRFGRTEPLWLSILSYTWILGLGIAGTIAYYVLYADYLKGEWYPTIGAFVASHGAVIGGSLHLYQRIKRTGSL